MESLAFNQQAQYRSNMEESVETAEDLFMKRFKALKRRNPPADLQSVIDVDNINCLEKVKRRQQPAGQHSTEHEGLIASEQWDIFELPSVPGALLVRNPFTTRLRKYLIARCLSDYPMLPNVSNLDTQPRPNEDIWRSANTGADDRAKKYLQKLRWVTLGYHYDWTKKIYVRDKRNDFPTDLSTLTQYILHTVLGEEAMFKAEAAIVNYYHLDSSLSGHTDHSEFDLTAPLISISFGLPCVFMIGGHTKTLEPEAIFLRDGDVFIMSGKARMSYHAVPKVLTTIPSSSQSNEDNATHTDNTGTQPCSVAERPFRETGKRCTDESQNDLLSTKRSKCESASSNLCDMINFVEDVEFWEPFDNYMKTSRINMNVRQVFEPGRGPADYIWPEKDTYEVS